MNKRRLGVSQRAYARLAGVALSYVQKLIRAGKLPTLPDGTLDARACDAARARNTNMYRGERRRMRQAARAGAAEATLPIYHTCSGCHESFREIDARAGGSPDPRRFCSGQCCSDVAAGLSTSQIRRRVNREAGA